MEIERHLANECSKLQSVRASEFHGNGYDYEKSST